MEHNHSLRVFSLLFDGAVDAPGRQLICHSLTSSPAVSVFRQNAQRQNLGLEGSLSSAKTVLRQSKKKKSAGF